MQFEIHITVNSDDFGKWKDLCKKLAKQYRSRKNKLKIKPLWIQNSNGWYSRQMLCAIDYAGSFLGARALIANLSGTIRDNGFKVNREKVECGFKKWPSSFYNECHIKIVLPLSENNPVLSFCAANSLLSSWSLTYKSTRKRKWYLTFRDHSLGFRIADTNFKRAINAVYDRFGEIEAEKETVILDTNPGLDRGWV